MTGANGLTVEQYADFNALGQLRTQWDELVAQEKLGPAHCLNWLEILWGENGAGRKLTINVVRDRGRAVGFAPMVTHVEQRKGVAACMVAPLSILNQLHGTQLILAADYRAAALESLLDSVRRQQQTWDILFMYFIEGEPQALALESCLKLRRLPFVIQPAARAPYLALRGSWDETLAGLQSRFRTTLRSRERRLREKARVELRFYDSPGEIEQALAAIAEIERASWKQNSGLPITHPSHWSFYQRYARAMAGSSVLRLSVLHVDDEPVAFDYGLQYDGTYYLLQTSYKETWHEQYPGFVLRKLLIERLCSLGVKEIDFGGDATDWKLKWTDQARAHRFYTIFNRSMRGRYLGWLNAAGRTLRRR